MKVLELANYKSPCLWNFGRNLKEMGKEFREEGDTVVYCFPEYREWWEEFRKEGLEVVEVNMERIWEGVEKVKKIVEEKGIDIIHTHFGKEVQLISMLVRMFSSLRVKIVWHWRNPIKSDITSEGRVKKFISKWGYRSGGNFLVDLHLVVSYEIERLLKEKGIKKVKTIHNPVDVEWYSKKVNLPTIYPYNTGLPIVLNVSNFRPQKDHFTFLKAISMIIKENSKPRFVLIGEGELKGKVKQYAYSLGISSHVTFLPVQCDIRSFLFGADFCVLTTHYEGLPNIICEAFAMGKPFIATKVGGVEEIIKDEENGFLVEKGDVKGLKERMNFLLQNKEMRKKMGEKGKKLVEEEFNLKKWIKRIRKEFKGLN